MFWQNSKIRRSFFTLICDNAYQLLTPCYQANDNLFCDFTQNKKKPLNSSLAMITLGRQLKNLYNKILLRSLKEHHG